MNGNALKQCTNRGNCVAGNEGWQPRENFGLRTSSPDGLQLRCKACRRLEEKVDVPPEKRRKRRVGAPVQPSGARGALTEAQLPPPDGHYLNKPFWTVVTVAEVLGEKPKNVYNHMHEGKFGAWQMPDRTYVVYAKGFIQAARYFEELRTRRAQLAEKHAKLAAAHTQAQDEVQLQFPDLPTPPSDLIAAVALWLEVFEADIARRAAYHEMPVESYWETKAAESIRNAYYTLRDEYQRAVEAGNA